MPKPKPVNIVWFKRDLRVTDHRPLVEAGAHGPVLPLLIVEPGWWAEPDMSYRQYAFYAECVADLQAALGSLGQPLIIRVGEAVDVFSRIAKDIPIAEIWSHAETGNAWTFARDRAVAAWCRSHSVRWRQIRQDGVVRGLKSRDGWARRWDQRMSEPVTPAPDALRPLTGKIDCGVIPAPLDLGLTPDGCATPQPGGWRAANETLASFLDRRGETYRTAMSSPITGETACSRLSPYLAWGACSTREITQQTRGRQRAIRAEAGPGSGRWRGALISFTGRLHWHCHFMQKLEDEPRIEFENMHPGYDGLRRPEDSDAGRLNAWAKGETGLPFVDACMRYLNATGWLNFRMRAMLTATASYHLWLDWRAPGLHLARQFTDYEPGIHWPQIQMQSGTTGINTVRIYNPIKQGHDQDPAGDFVRRWVPELAGLPGAAVHEPWKHPDAVSILDKTYPMPIVDHLEAARAARQKIYGARKGTAFREVADAIQSKHGSRKSGIAMTGRRSSARSTARTKTRNTRQDQLELDLETGPEGKDA